MKLWVVALLLCFSCYSVQGEEEKDARLLASKNILNQYMVEDKDLTVEYKIYNVGGSAAMNVQLKDSSFPATDFSVLHGSLEVTWERIAPGSNVTHAVILRPLKSGYFNFTAAEVFYLPRDNSKEIQVGYTTAPGEGGVVNKKEFDRRFSPHVHWAFSDIRSGRVLTKVTDTASGTTALTCAQFHPDGLIFGTGTEDSVIKIWDLKERTNVANFPGHQGPITSIAFSENGYYLATSAEDSVVKLWDLRKLKNFRTIQLPDKYELRNLCFDQSGTYLAIAGSDVRVYLCKQWNELVAFNDHTATATGVCFGNNATYIASGSMDRSLKYFGLPDH